MNNKRIAGLLCLMLVCAMLGGCTVGARSWRLGPQSQTAAAKAAAGTGVHTSNLAREEMKRVSRAEMTVLYYDDSSRSIAVYDANAKQLWRALPDWAGDDAAMLTVTVLVDGKTYTLNSQDDCPGEGGVTVSFGEDSVMLTYHFDALLAGETRLQFDLPLSVAVTDGRMLVQVDCAALQNKSFQPLSVAVLPFFGARQSGEADDFLLLPDGCGSIIKTEKTPKQFAPIAVPMYTPAESGGPAGLIPAFGQKAGNGAFLALVEQGDAMAEIRAEKATAAGGCNRVYAAFSLADAMTRSDGTLFVSKQSFAGTLTLSYRFLAQEAASYIGMAAACRELLLQNGTLHLLSPSAEDGALPFHLSVIAAAGCQVPGETAQTLHTFTTFDEMLQLTQYLRSKGISGIRLRCRGLFLGALEQRRLTVSATVSENRPLSAFQSELQAQGVLLFPEVQLLSGAKGHVGKPAKALDGKPMIETVSPLRSNVIGNAAQLSFCSADRMEKRASDQLQQLLRLQTDGVCLDNAANVLYADASAGKNGTKQSMRDRMFSILPSFASQQSLMVVGANLYAMRDACDVLELPHEAAVTNSLTKSVPFVQAVLHGYTSYSAFPMNRESDLQTAVLRAAEFGEAPYFEWYAADFSTDEQADNLSYLNTVTQAQQCYEKLQKLFDGLADKQISAHEEVRRNVFCTTYGVSDRIYVNYNEKDVTVHGVTVEARNALRVSG